jgi:hypothetical protein
VLFLRGMETNIREIGIGSCGRGTSAMSPAAWLNATCVLSQAVQKLKSTGLVRGVGAQRLFMR